MSHRRSLAVFPVLAAALACAGSRDPPGERQDAAAIVLGSAIAKGESLYARDAYGEAQTVWHAALELARAEQHALAEARITTWLGLAAWRLGELQEARRRGEEALAIKLQHELRELLPRSYNALALLAWYEGRLKEAAALFDSTMLAARAVGDDAYLAKGAGNLGLVQADFGRFDDARRGFEAQRAAGRDLEDAIMEGNALVNLAMLATWMGDPRQAVGLVAEGRVVYASVGYRTGEEAALGQLASAYTVLGEPQLALAALDTALGLSREIGLRRQEAANLEGMATLFQEAGDYRRALDFYVQARVINRALDQPDETATDLRSEAEVHLALGNLDRALRHGQEALAIHDSIGTQYSKLADLRLLAEVSHRLDRSAELSRYLTQARTLAARLGTRSARLDVALTHARIAGEREDPRAVLRVLDAVLADAERAEHSMEWEVHTRRAQALRRLGRLPQAEQSARRAVDAVERVRGNVQSGMLRSSLLADRAVAYHELTGVLLERGKVAEAFEAADAARDRHLAMRRSTEAAAANPLSQGITEREAILGRIDRLATAIREYQAFDDVQAIGELEARLEQARREYELLVIRATGGARAAPPTLETRRRNAAAVRAVLGANEALLEYQVTREQLRTFVVTNDRIRHLQAEIPAKVLAGRVRLARELVADPAIHADQARAVLSALHGLLIKPVVDAGALDGTRRLIVVPDADLTYLPFGALVDPVTGRYLVEGFSLLYLPSASALLALRGQHVPRPGGTAQYAAFAPLVDSLPASLDEVRAVERHTNPSKTYLGKQATEVRVRDALADGRVVHVASHGIMNARNPLFSRILLAGSAGSGSSTDGRLEVHEILGLEIRSPLVVLSGCETGVGGAWATGFAHGEDYATLARAFLYAGARNVVATLWPITDRGAAEVAGRFYGHMTNTEPGTALALTQREMLLHPRYSHPYYWAAYRLAGDGELGGWTTKAAAVSVSR